MKILKKTLCILLCTIMLISVIPAGAFNAIRTDNHVSEELTTGDRSDPVKTVFTAFKVLLDKLIYYIKLIINILRQLLGLDNRLTVSFETQGGSEISPVKVPKGGTLAEVPTPVKQDYAFTGWYLDQALTESFYSDAPIENSITLYASYAERDPNLENYGDRTKYLEDCAPDFTFAIVSPFVLTTANLSAYVQIEAFSGELPAFKVTHTGGAYTISSASPYPAGGHYRFTLLDSALRFDGEDDGIRALVIRIHKDEVRVVELKDGIVYVLWQDVTKLGDGAYSVPSSLYTVGTGDKVCFWDGTINDSTLYCNILLASPIAGEGTGDGITVLYTENSGLEDILKEVNVYFKQDVPVSEYINGTDTAKIAQKVKNSKGTLQITEILAKALSLSPSVQAVSNGAAPAASGFEDVLENNDKVTISISDLIPGLSVSASIGSAVNPNFLNAGSADWAVLTLTFSYSAVIQGKVQISASFTIKEYVKSTMQGYKEWKGTDLNFDYALNTYSQTQISLTVLIRSYESSEDDYLDITAEIEALLNDDEGDDGDPAGILRTVLGGKGDDIDLLDENLYSYTLAIIPAVPIFQVNFDVNFVVKVNFAVGISTGITVMSARQVGFCGSMGSGITSYNYELPGNNRYSFDLYACGYLGFKAGLKMSISLSFYGLKDLGEVGLSGEVGAYIDLYGFLHLNISKLNQYGASQTSLQGGLYMEVGIYIEINLFARSDTFKVKAEYTAYEHKWPLFTLGDRYVMLRFKDTTGTFIMNADTYTVSTGAGLLDAVYLDMTTGEEVTGNYSSANKFMILFSSPYLSYDRLGTQKISVLKDRFGSYAYTPRIAAGTKRLDATVSIYYMGSNLAFSRVDGGYAVKKVPIIWLDASLNPASVLNAYKATYVFDIDGVETTVGQKSVLYGEIPGSMDLYEYYYDYKITGYTNDFNAPITADTVYKVHMLPYQKLVSFITYYGGSWHLDVYAVNIGEVPAIPAGFNSSQPFKTFTGWRGESGSNARMPEVYEVAAAEFNIAQKGWNFIYAGLDTTAPLHSLAGTYEQCLNDYWSGRYAPANATYCEAGLYLYTARYENQPVDVTFVFPAMSYTAFGQNIVNTGTTKTAQVEVGEIIGAPSYTGYAGCNMLGWDINGDAVPDYTYTGLPAAVPGMTFTAVFRLRTHTVTVLDINGNLTETLTVNTGNRPGILGTTPVYSDGSGAVYNFKYWLISKSGGAFTRWYAYQDPGVYENWSVMPHFDKLFTVTFDFNGGTLGGETQRTVQLKEGAYNTVDIITQSPVKASTLYDDFTFAGWDCGATFTVAGNRTLTAQYTAVPIEYTAEFTTERGSFAGGGTYDIFTGGYDAWQAYITDFLAANAALAAVYTPDKIFTFAAWFIYNGEHSVRYEARWTESPRYYTVAFNAGQGAFAGGTVLITYPPPEYGTLLDFTGEAINKAAKPADVYNTFKLAGWEDQNGTFYAPTDTLTVTGDLTFTAVYEVDEQVLYTVTLNAGAGKFPDGTSIKTFSGAYGVNTNIVVDDPAWVTNYANLYYVFAAWSQAIPAVFTQDIAITAQYSTVFYEFTVTFDAGTGTFASTGTNILTQIYHYGDTIVMNEAPVKAEDEYFTYTFDGWNLPFTPVTYDKAYTATYLAQRKGNTLPPTGITVTDGTITEDICTNSIPGYTYDMVLTYDGLNNIPLLTVTGVGLTFSGSSSEVYIIVEDDVPDVTFNNLTLSGAFSLSDAPLVFSFNESTIDTIVTIMGDCLFANTAAGYHAVRCNSWVGFEGADTTDSLTLSSVDACTVYCEQGIDFSNLTLDVNAAATGEDSWVAAFTGDGFEENFCVFDNMTVNINSGGDGFQVIFASIEMTDTVFNATCAGSLGLVDNEMLLIDTALTAESIGFYAGGNITVRGNSAIDFVSTDSNFPAIETGGSLLFEDFTGSFDVRFIDPAASVPAVRAGAEITFSVGGIDALDSYDLDGAQIALLEPEPGNSYRTFAVDEGAGWVPDTSVSVTPNHTKSQLRETVLVSLPTMMYNISKTTWR